MSRQVVTGSVQQRQGLHGETGSCIRWWVTCQPNEIVAHMQHEHPVCLASCIGELGSRITGMPLLHLADMMLISLARERVYLGQMALPEAQSCDRIRYPTRMWGLQFLCQFLLFI